MRRFAPLLIAAGVVLFLALNSFVIVRQDQQAIVLRLGNFSRAYNAGEANEAGLKLKIPFFETVVFFSKRNLGLPLSGQSVQVADQEFLIVDAFVRWRIENPLTFFQNAQTLDNGADRLENYARAAVGRALGAATSDEVISGRRAELMNQIESDLNAAAATELGVRVIDVRIRQADLPPDTLERAYDRMRSERAQEAQRYRAEGEEAAARIRAEADRQVVVIRAEANEQSERLRGEGEGQRAAIFARAYGRDAEFAAFYRSMRAYEIALDQGTPLVIPPDSDFFRYMQSREGRR